MASPNHDAWLKTTLGLEGGTSEAAALPAPGPDKQSQEFHAKMQAALGPMDEAVAFVTANADPAKGAALAAKRAALVGAYQGAAAKIDPADETKGKAAIGQALGQAQGAANEAKAAKDAAQKALDAWKTAEPKGEEADGQIAEMTEWGHPKAPPLRAPLDALLAQAGAKKYVEAIKALVTCLPTVKPVWDDYQKQKTAQAEYDPAHATMEPRLGKAAACTFKTLEATNAKLAPAVAAMDKDATGKNYVAALAKQKALGTQLDDYEKKLADLEAKKAAYVTAHDTLKPKLEAAAAVQHPSMAKMQQEIVTLVAPMEKLADAEQFEKALPAANDLSSKCDQFDAAVKELEQKKKDFDEKMAALQLRLDAAARCAFKTLDPLKAELGKMAAPIQEKAKAEDFKGAMDDLTALSGRVDEFESQVKQVEEKKKNFEDARKELDPKLQAIGAATPHKSLDADKKAIDDAIPLMEKAGGDEDYGTAMTSAVDIGQKADKYTADATAIDDKKKAFDEAWAKVKPDLDAINQSRNDDLAPMQQTILKTADDIQKQATAEDYAAATTAAEGLARMFDEYKKASDGKMYEVVYKGQHFYGTEKELTATKLKLVKAGIAQAFPPIQHRAEALEGQHDDLKKLNDKQYIVAWIVTGIGGAHLENVASAIATHKTAIATMQGATDAEAAETAYKAACAAVTATGKAMTAYMTALDFGGSIVIGALEAVEITCFAVAATCGGALIAGPGASLLASMAANGIAATGFGGLEALAQQAAPLTQGETVDWKAASAKIGKAALLNGVGGLLGGAMGGKLKEEVGEQIVKRLAIDNPEVEKRVLGAIEGAMGNLVQAAIANRPDLGSGSITVGQFITILVENAISGGVAGAIAPGGKLTKAATAGVVGGAAIGGATVGVARDAANQP